MQREEVTTPAPMQNSGKMTRGRWAAPEGSIHTIYHVSMLKTVQDSLKKSPTTLKEIELKNQEVIAAQAEILISPLQIRGKFPRFLKAPLAAGLCEEMRK